MRNKVDITDITGSFGRWQKWIFSFVFYIGVVGMWQNLSITFMAPNVPFRCVNSTEQCSVSFGNQSFPCTEWEYDTSVYSENIVTEWDLVCDREWLVSLAKSIYMIGFLLSVSIFGQLSDWIGRYPVLVISYGVTLISTILSLFSSSYQMFITLRFFQAFGRTGFSTTLYVLLMEIVGEQHRTNVGILVQLGWSSAFVTLPLVAYFIRGWFWLQLAIGIPVIPYIIVFRWLPESPRWLLLQGKYKKLEKLLETAAKINGKTFDKSSLDLLELEQKKEKSKSVLDLFKTPHLRKRILCMFYLWIVNAFMYYGLSYNTNDLAGDPFINCLIAGALEFPSYAVLLWGISRLGRRPTMIALMMVAGVSCGAMFIQPPSMPWLPTTLAMIGKFCITASFGLLYLYTSELFPTVVRNVAIGSSSTTARIGSILAPFVRELGKATYPWMPNLVYAFLAFSSGLLTLLVPETRGTQIADTLDQGENLFENHEEEILLTSSQIKPRK